MEETLRRLFFVRPIGFLCFLQLLGLLCFPFLSCELMYKKKRKKKTAVDCMIKVIALATAFVQTTPTGWVCLLSDLTANVCHLLDVAWSFCSFLTFLHVNILENSFPCT